MALIDCPECGEEVSDQTESCPNCGYPVNSDKKKNKNTKENAEKNGGCIAQILFFGGLLWLLFIGWIALDVYTKYQAQMGAEQNIKMLFFFAIGVAITWKGGSLMGWFKSPF